MLTGFGEVSPGLHVTTRCTPGTAIVMAEPFPLPGAPLKLIFIHPVDWAKIPPTDRERFASELTSGNAEHGQRVLEAWLARR